jgi:signal transduction histidine kinase
MEGVIPPGHRNDGRQDVKRAEAIASLALLMLVVIGGVGAWRAARSAAEGDALVDHTHQVIEATSGVFQELADAETGQRGYLITGRDAYLQPFEHAAPQVTNSITLLQALIADNPTQQANLRRLRSLTDNKLAELQSTIDLRRTQGLDAAVALVDSDAGKRVMDDIRSLIGAIQTEERRLLDVRSVARAAADRWMLRIGAVTAALVLLAFGHGLMLLRAAERRLEESSTRLRATLENVPQGVLLVDATCRVVEWNVRLTALLGLSLPIKRAVTTGAELQAHLAAHLAGAPRLFVVPPPGPTEFAIGHRSVEVVGRTVASGGAIWTVQDVTERRTAERIAIQSQRLEAVGQMTGGIAHDFNNLLTAVMGNLELAAKRLDDRPRVANMLQHAALAAERGRQLVAQLLTFGRQRTLEAELIDPSALIERMADVFRTTLGGNATLRLELGNVHERVLVDSGQLELGLLNLVLNARDAMRSTAAGTLTIALSVINLATPNPRLGGITPGRYVQIRLSDTGVGMSEDVRDRAFEPFFTTKSVGEGSGLGLSQTYGVVKQFKGAITLDSAVGAGTTITLHLPIATPMSVPEREAARDLATMPRLVGPAGRGRVLVVEDDALVRDFTTAILRDLGFEVL